jgi:hypothetical protein
MNMKSIAYWVVNEHTRPRGGSDAELLASAKNAAAQFFLVGRQLPTCTDTSLGGTFTGCVDLPCTAHHRTFARILEVMSLTAAALLHGEERR